MAFKLDKGEINQFEKLKRGLSDTYSELEASVEDYNNKVTELRADVDNSLTLYNGALAELRAFVEEVASDRRNEFDERSDSWREGDAGSTAEEWVSTWEEADLEEGTIEFPDLLELGFDSHADIDLPSEP